MSGDISLFLDKSPLFMLDLEPVLAVRRSASSALLQDACDQDY